MQARTTMEKLPKATSLLTGTSITLTRPVILSIACICAVLRSISAAEACVENSSEPTAAAVLSLFLVTIVCHHKDNFADHVFQSLKVFGVCHRVAVGQQGCFLARKNFDKLVADQSVADNRSNAVNRQLDVRRNTHLDFRYIVFIVKFLRNYRADLNAVDTNVGTDV